MFSKYLKYFFAFSFFGALTISNSYANFDFNANCVQAYESILSLKLKRARVQIDQEKAVHPNNSITILLDNYYDYFWLLTTENKADFDRLKNNKGPRLDKLEDEDKNSPYYNFCQAQVNLQWALLHSRFGENTTAGFEVNRAYRLLQSNAKKFPGFLPDDIPLGMVNILLGSLPDGALKSALSFFGIKGNTATGLNMLEQLTGKLPKSGYAFYYDELVFYLTYVQAYVINDSAAFAKMQQYTASIDSSSLLKTYIKAFVAIRTGHSTEAIAYLEHRPMGNDYQPYPYLDYLLAIAKMNKLDTNADDYFRKYLNEYKGVNYIKDAYWHMAWYYLLQGDEHKYQSYVQLVKTKGYNYHDKDKQALAEASGPAPQPELLKARLLFDGGIYDKALAILRDLNPADLKQVQDKAEYYYRQGRIYEAMNKDEDALRSYQQTIAAGKGTASYYAPTAALRIGGIYEGQKNRAEAVHYYNMAIAFKNHQYENSIEQKAKEGIKRLGF
ncbi:tetratricopeptide repeat protein [Mucilaginibacter sp. RS28]|uniref:Tetratricopeptide repeat protein n=1 Tax=Mucilaginibacter straminoryzae TaxID=2932774 RepID=A0A9X1XBM4_9SPHI|nr:tetratricopeptide repeat protein [Mucilaginibacter straminoryzae]MCJ8211759.1 tetratricopeptide repeat protein [Mucilaginibacter straminoryzae]